MDEDKVTVHVEANYDVVSVALSEFGEDTAEGWEQLRELLHGRPGWRYVIFDNGPDELTGGWAFPEYGGAAVLIVFAETDRFRVYDKTPTTTSTSRTLSPCVLTWPPSRTTVSRQQ